MTYSHYSQQRISKLRRRRYAQQALWQLKPNGLWLSVDGEYDWPWWCNAERFRTSDLAYRYCVELAPDARIRFLKSPAAIDLFTKQYGYVPVVNGSSLHSTYIDWSRVATKWDGLVIAPYCWERRMERHTFWYYGWDCASGCVWNTDAILSFRLAEKGVKLRA